jgi:hypothetical protein
MVIVNVVVVAQFLLQSVRHYRRLVGCQDLFEPKRAIMDTIERCSQRESFSNSSFCFREASRDESIELPVFVFALVVLSSQQTFLSGFHCFENPFDVTLDLLSTADQLGIRVLLGQ